MTPEEIVRHHITGLVEELSENDKELISDIEQYANDKVKEYAEFCVKCDREGLPLLEYKDWMEHYN